MGMDEGIRHSPPSEERINIPADPRHYWRYRMHLSLEQLQSLKDFNFHLRKMIQESGRA
jgi:4-alpha-glucanotransferase